MKDANTMAVAMMTTKMITIMEFNTDLPKQIKTPVLWIFQKYWREEITFSQLLHELPLAGYHYDLDQYGFNEFINKEDLH
jgi:hypothetical protein